MLKIRGFLFLFVWFCATYRQDIVMKSMAQNILSAPNVLKPDDSCDCPKRFATSVSNCKCVRSYLCIKETNKIDYHGGDIADEREDDGCPSQHLCCGTNDGDTKPKNSKAPSCGQRKADGVNIRTVGDMHEANFGEYPWMVAILYTEEFEGIKSSPEYQCGGSLVHPRAVITAAHCVRNREKEYIVRAGEWNLQDTTETYPSQDRKVKRIVIHPHYNAGALYNDIAFLLLESSINMSQPHVGVICLPKQDATFPGDTKCLLTGWGTDKTDKEGRYQDVLQKIDLPIVERNDCQRTYRRTRHGGAFVLDRSFLCAGGLKNDACKGDGGSPLVCPIPGIKHGYQQVGIVSWGAEECGNGIPGIYADVAHFRTWIDEQIVDNELDTSTYTW